MKRGVAVLAFGLLVAGCGGGAGPAEAPSRSAASASPAVSYADQFIEAFKLTYGTGGTATGGAGTNADWSGFASTVEDIEPPDGYTTQANQVTAAWEAYADARQELTDICDRSPGSGDCYGGAIDASNAWRDALDRSYLMPGLSYEALLA